MNIKSYIRVNLLDGSHIAYVNSTVQDGLGKSGLYYSYTNTAGNKLANQTGAGKAFGDYTSLIGQIGDSGLITWPEGGTTLSRKNFNNSNESLATILTTVPKKNILDIVLIEQEVNEFEQLEIDRG